MSPPKSLLLVAAVAIPIAALLITTADATVETTCKAAAGIEARVDYGFCVAELNKHRDSPGADAWGLAKVAANLGVNDAGGAVRDADDALASGAADGRTRAALGQCRRLYFDAELAFAGAYDEINGRDYAAGKRMAAEAASLARRCDEVFAEAGLQQSPLARHGEYAVRIAAVCAAITDLINWARIATATTLTFGGNAENAVYDIKVMLGSKAGATRAALAQCQKLYRAVEFAFAEADDEITARNYAAGKAKVAEAVSLTHQCDGDLDKASVLPSPLAQHSSYSVKIAVICTAITNLIK
ncbi:hypothetical protein EJB05_21436, partial [Eragrostis curvula]